MTKQPSINRLQECINDTCTRFEVILNGECLNPLLDATELLLAISSPEDRTLFIKRVKPGPTRS
eukprot:2905991-Amphidinium_carterae.2